MTREASVATLRRLAEALDDQWGELPTTAQRQRLSECMKAYRSEIAPLRTRGQVDADLVSTVRSAAQNAETGVGFTNSVLLQLIRLCREPTAPDPAPTPGRWRVGTRVPEHVYLDDKPICTMPSADLARAVVAAMNSGPSSADAEEVPSPRPPASPAGADLIQRVELLERYLGPSALEWALSQMPSGPPGAVAAKESRDNAAAPEGAAYPESHACNPGERECNCDQALHLEKRIGDAVRAIRRSNTIPAGLLHELLGILEGEA